MSLMDISFGYDIFLFLDRMFISEKINNMEPIIKYSKLYGIKKDNTIRESPEENKVLNFTFVKDMKKDFILTKTLLFF